MKVHKPIYLDYAAATPLDPSVKAAMEPFWSRAFYNPSATYLAAQLVSKALSEARAKVAAIVGARPAEIVFTAGGTEANNLAIQGVMQAYPDANVVVSQVEHDSIIEPANKYNHKAAQVLPNGQVDLDDLRSKIDDSTVMISIIYANNEIGTIQPIREVSKLLADVRLKRLKTGNKLPLYFHSDACQAAAYLDLHVRRLGVDMLTLNGGKIYGPKQSGVLYVKTGTVVKPQILGGGQESGRRSGTENVGSIVGLATALELVQSRREFEAARLRTLQGLFLTELANKLPKSIINGTLKYRLPNNLHITIPGQDNERLMMQLDEAGILCATGSACSASNEEPSHVLKAIGLSDALAQASLRFSMGRDTSKADIIYTVTTLARIVNGLRP